MTSPVTPPAVLNPKKALRENLEGEQFKLAIAQLKSRYITPERMVRIALNAINRIPDLAECTQPSFFSALMRLSEVGLEPDSYHAHIIPFNNKVKGSNPPKYRKEAQLIIDYKGLITVIRRNPAIAVVKGGVVYKQDKFIYREGSDRYFEHEPAWAENDEIVGAYSFVKFANINDWEVDFLPRWRIEKARQRSRASDRGPWVTDYDEMCIKTVIRHHAKTLPLTMEERQVTLIDDDTIDLEEDKSRRLPQRTAEFKKTKFSEPEQEPESGESDAGDDDSQEVNNGEPPQEEVSEEQKEQERVAAIHAKSLEKLQKLMSENKVSDTELITVLSEYSDPVGDAEDTSKVGSLPIETINKSVKQWPSILFSINAKRKLATATIDK